MQLELFPSEQLNPDSIYYSLTEIDYIENPNKGLKYDQDKPRFSLVPPLALREAAKVLTYGAQKYDAENWRMVEDARSRYFDAALRHMNQYSNKNEPDEDDETDLSHLAHALVSLMFVLELELMESEQ